MTSFQKRTEQAGNAAGQSGYATLALTAILPLVFLCLGLIAFSLLKTRHSQELKSVCRSELHGYFHQLRSQIIRVEKLNPIAMSLYKAQIALTPFLWDPAAMALYQKILKLRQRFEQIQTNLITVSNSTLAVRSYKVISAVQRKLQSENKKIQNLLQHGSRLTFRVHPKMQIVKRQNVLFSPYDPHKQIQLKQEFTIHIKNQIDPKSYIGFFKTKKLTEFYTCSATIKAFGPGEFTIFYKI